MKISNKIPLLLPLVFLLLGIIYSEKAFNVQEIIPSNFYFIFIPTIISLAVLLKSKTKISAYTFIFLSGALLLQNQKSENFNLLKKIENQKIDVIATVTNKENINSSNIKEKIRLKVKQLKKNKLFEPAKFNLLCYSCISTNIIPGQRVQIKNIEIKKTETEKKSNPFKYFLLKNGILSSFFAKRLNYKIIAKNINPIKQYLYKIRKKIAQKIRYKLSSQTFPYFSSIFLGNKKETISSQQKNIFNIWGISHYLARSGLHIVIFIIIWQLILNLVPLPIKTKTLLLIVISLIYLALSWASLSFMRAFFIFILYQLSKLLNKQANFLHLLTLICLLILIKNPIQLFSLDFQLTFALTFALSISSKSFM